MRRLVTGTLLLVATSSIAAAQSANRLSLPAQLEGKVMPAITVPDLTPPGPGTGFNNPIYQSPPGMGLDGVARLFMLDDEGYVTSGCTGTLLYTGWDVLTAAHCISDGHGNLSAAGVNVGFLNPDGGVTKYNSRSLYFKPGYGDTGDAIDPNDLAIVRLDRQADPWITRYKLASGSSLFEQALFAGFGLTGNGETGGYHGTLFNELINHTSPVRRYGFNSWDSTIDLDYIYNYDGSAVMISDFDGPDPYYNSICSYWGANFDIGQTNPYGLSSGNIAQLCGTSYGDREVAIGSGDSGGPGFVLQGGELRVAGVASWGTVACFEYNEAGECVDVRGGYFGAVAGHVSTTWADNRNWITATTVPEPGTIVLLATGLGLLLGVVVVRRRSAAAI